jgi:HD-GYP domain-containing protein (c-di-GMP phosphodiesterase class II)
VALTLLVENNPKIIEIYQLNLQTYVGLELVVANNADEAITELKSNAFKLIICRAKMGKTEVAESLAQFLSSQKQNIPLFVIGHGIYPQQAHSTLAGSLDVKGVIKGAASALGITAQQMAQKKVDEYFSLNKKFLKAIHYPCCPIHIKNEKNEYSNLVATNQKLDPQLLRAHENVFVHKLDRLHMVNQITAELISLLDDTDLNPDEQIQAGNSNLELISKKLMSIGINEETIQLAKKSMTSLANNTKKYPQLGQLLSRMLANKAGYLYRHTQIVTYVSLHMVKNIDWGTPEQEEKICFISFFHDIALENDVQAKIKNKDELRKSNLDTREKSLVDKHAQLAAELVHKYPHAPMGSDQIIRQHHGMLNGIGFSDHFGANLSPMAIVFVVAEEFTRIIIEQENGPFDTKEMTKRLRTSFPTNRFQKMIDSLEKITF